MSSRSGPQRAKRAAIGVLLAVAIALLLRLESVEFKRTPSHDEAISFIAATCHQRAYDDLVARGSHPLGTAVRAAQWQRFWHVEDKLCLGEIGNGLAETDVHPPLYFWALHVWSLIAGVGLAQGLWLNLVIVSLTAVALAGLGRLAFRDDAEAVVLSAVWVLSPAAVSTSTEARQYDLLALVTVLFVWQFLRVIRTERPLRAGDAVLLAVLTAAGV